MNYIPAKYQEKAEIYDSITHITVSTGYKYQLPSNVELSYIYVRVDV